MRAWLLQSATWAVTVFLWLLAWSGLLLLASLILFLTAYGLVVLWDLSRAWWRPTRQRWKMRLWNRRHYRSLSRHRGDPDWPPPRDP